MRVVQPSPQPTESLLLIFDKERRCCHISLLRCRRARHVTSHTGYTAYAISDAIAMPYAFDAALRHDMLLAATPALRRRQRSRACAICSPRHTFSLAAIIDIAPMPP